jgi:hypothetical protein
MLSSVNVLLLVFEEDGRAVFLLRASVEDENGVNPGDIPPDRQNLVTHCYKSVRLRRRRH